jgi:membrane protein DedA with SNARE-associated domain/membrane-associated phospholipid phosphatase
VKMPRLTGHRLTLLIVGLLGLLLLLFKDELPSFNLEHILESVSGSLGAWTYLLVGGLAFLETGAFVGLVAPGEFTVMLGGAVAAQGDISLPLILGIAWFGAWAGDSVSFMIGSKLGRGFLSRNGPRVGIDEKRLDQVDAYFDRHGGKTILIGRFIGLVRALAPFIAGSSHMRYREFVPYSILGTGLWASGLTLAGYFASRSLDKIAAAVGRGLLAFGITVGVIVALVVLVRFFREADNRKRLVASMEGNRLLRPLVALGRRFRPQAQFVWRRLTPGGPLGLEVTSLLAAASIGLYVLVAYWVIVSGDPGPTPGDQTAIDVVDSIRAGWLTHVAKVVTALGSTWVVAPVVSVSAVVLAVKRRWTEFWVLLAGVAIIFTATPLIKHLIDRPRPAGGLVSAPSQSFPSGHASHSTIWIWLGVTVAIRFRPGLTARSAAIAAGIAVSVLVGLSRVYLGVHYLSDVNAGWGLGVAAFAGAGATALVISHFRQNVRPDAESDRVRAGPRPDWN